jgi:hypothetical protein
MTNKIKLIEELTIKIWRSEIDCGYYYDIFDTTADSLADSIDGGICSSDMPSALEMANEQASRLLKSNWEAHHRANLAIYNELNQEDKEEVDQRMKDQQEADSQDDDEWDGTPAQYLNWALEELFENKK